MNDEIKTIKGHMPEDMNLIKKQEIIDEKCPKCGSNLVLRIGKNRDIVACSNYPKCKYIYLKENNIKENSEELIEHYSSRFKKGKREDIEEDVRSAWESNIIRVFEYQNIKYKYEREAFRLFPNSKYRFASPSYLPDFILEDGTIIEVKGHLNYRSLHNLKRFKDLYPKEIIKIIDNDIYSLIEKKYKDKIDNWEDSKPTKLEYIDIVGINIKERIPFVNKLNIKDELILIREKENKYDNNAIKVTDINNYHIGYVDSFYACYLAPKLDLGINYRVKLVEKKDGALKCSIEPTNLDDINITDFYKLL